jgi:hypothetical protein
MRLYVAVSPGELLDRLTILEIRAGRVSDPVKLAHVRAELAEVRRTWAGVPAHRELSRLAAELAAVNLAIWDAADSLRRHEAAQDFGPAFVELARSVYRHNDRRAALKRKVNVLLGSALAEVKQLPPY